MSSGEWARRIDVVITINRAILHKANAGPIVSLPTLRSAANTDLTENGGHRGTPFAFLRGENPRLFVEARTMRTKSAVFGLLFVGLLLTTIVSADDAKDKAIAKDRKRIEGTWRVTSLVIDGNKSKAEDVNKITVVNDANGTWNLRAGNKEIGKGTSKFDPTKKPRTIDFTPTEGESKGEHFLGIYQLGKKSRKLCFAPAGKERPTKFSSTSDNQHILVTFERVKSE